MMKYLTTCFTDLRIFPVHWWLTAGGLDVGGGGGAPFILAFIVAPFDAALVLLLFICVGAGPTYKKALYTTTIYI